MLQNERRYFKTDGRNKICLGRSDVCSVKLISKICVKNIGWKLENIEIQNMHMIFNLSSLSSSFKDNTIVLTATACVVDVSPNLNKYVDGDLKLETIKFPFVFL